MSLTNWMRVSGGTASPIVPSVKCRSLIKSCTLTLAYQAGTGSHNVFPKRSRAFPPRAGTSDNPRLCKLFRRSALGVPVALPALPRLGRTSQRFAGCKRDRPRAGDTKRRFKGSVPLCSLQQGKSEMFWGDNDLEA